MGQMAQSTVSKHKKEDTIHKKLAYTQKHNTKDSKYNKRNQSKIKKNNNALTKIKCAVKRVGLHPIQWEPLFLRSHKNISQHVIRKGNAHSHTPTALRFDGGEIAWRCLVRMLGISEWKRRPVSAEFFPRLFSRRRRYSKWRGRNSVRAYEWR